MTRNIKTVAMIATIAIVGEAAFAQCLFPAARQEPPPYAYQRQPAQYQYAQPAQYQYAPTQYQYAQPPPPPPPPAYGYGRGDGHGHDHGHGWHDGHERHDDRGGRMDDRRRDEPRRGGKWSTAANLSSGGGAKEVSFSGRSECKIEVTGGSVGFNTVVVRRGGRKQSVTIGQTLGKGQSVSIPIDSSVTGIRISDTGRGTYRVVVK